MPKKIHFSKATSLKALTPNPWDIAVILIFLGILGLIAWTSSLMIAPFDIGKKIEISLAPDNLPTYALQTVLRMFIALIFSLLFTFTVAPLAAKNKHIERFIIPFIDIMESVPVLGVLAITVPLFISLFPNSRLGPECAAIFAIFTSQVWNMSLSLYQSLKTIPKDLQDCANSFNLSSWQRFWRVEVPYGVPALLWNTMISMSAGWFFVVASEAISVSNQEISLPGIGSYVAKAVVEGNLNAVGYAILTMFIVILIYDQLLFRPLLAWADKFKPEITDDDQIDSSWFFDLLGRSQFLKYTGAIFDFIFDFFLYKPILIPNTKIKVPVTIKNNFTKLCVYTWNIALFLLVVGCIVFVYKLISETIALSEILHVLFLGLITGIKVSILIILASLFWIPIGVWIGLNQKVRNIVQPLSQFLAAFPANLLFPIFVIFISKYNLNPNIWLSPLLILGTQWYILFNVIVGTSSISKEMKSVAKNFNIKGWLWWKRLILPSIFPFYITGAMAAAGGCWNATIVADVVNWNGQTLYATGIGKYLVEYTQNGDFARIALGIAVMSLYVILINRLLWHKLYNLAENRFTNE